MHHCTRLYLVWVNISLIKFLTPLLLKFLLVIFSFAVRKGICVSDLGSGSGHFYQCWHIFNVVNSNVSNLYCNLSPFNNIKNNIELLTKMHLSKKKMLWSQGILKSISSSDLFHPINICIIYIKIALSVMVVVWIITHGTVLWNNHYDKQLNHQCTEVKINNRSLHW